MLIHDFYVLESKYIFVKKDTCQSLFILFGEHILNGQNSDLVICIAFLN